MHLLAVDCRPFSLRARTSKPANGQCTQHSAPRKGTAQRESSAVSVSSRSPTPTQPPPRSKPVPCVRTYGFFVFANNNNNNKTYYASCEDRVFICGCFFFISFLFFCKFHQLQARGMINATRARYARNVMSSRDAAFHRYFPREGNNSLSC